MGSFDQYVTLFPSSTIPSFIHMAVVEGDLLYKDITWTWFGLEMKI